MARVEQARGQLITTRSAIFPQFGYEGDALRGRQFFGFTGNRTFNVFAGVFNLSWELDLWGRIRRATEASQAELLASNDFRRGVLLSLVSEVAASYLTLRELDVELEIARRATQTFSDTLDLFVRQFEGGVGTKLAVARAEAALAQAAADIPDTERRIVATENAISILLRLAAYRKPSGLQPHRAAAAASSPGRPAGCHPGAPSRRAAGRGDAALGQRPGRGRDRRLLPAHRAHRPLRRPEHRAGGRREARGQRLADRRLGRRATVPGREIGRQLQIGEGELGGSKAQYEGTVLTALREVSDALVDAEKLLGVREESAKAVTALREASDLATIRFTGGLATYFEVLEAQQQLFPAETTLAQVELQQLLAVVRLYAALGGGWYAGEQQLPLNAFPNWPP